MLEALSSLFSLSGLLGFIIGVGSSRLYYWAQNRYAEHCEQCGKPAKLGTYWRVPKVNVFGSLTMLWTLFFVITGYVVFQSWHTDRDLEAMAKQTASCQHEFNVALKARGNINDENDQLSLVQRNALADWFRNILYPPPEIQAIQDSDPNFLSNPAYLQWHNQNATTYYNIIAEAQRKQKENDERRPEYPEPSCGATGNEE